MRNRLVVAGAIAAVVLVVLVALVTVLNPHPSLPWPRAGVMVAALVTVVAVTVLVLRRRDVAASRAVWFALPALVLGWLWWWPPLSSFGWFAYAPLSTVVVTDAPASDALLPALVVLLWALTVTGAVTVVGDESPVRVLTVVAIALTAPLWLPPGPRVTPAGALLSGDLVTAQPVVVRTASLALVLVVGMAVLLARRPATARATAYVLPAAELSWVWWQTAAGARASVMLAGGVPEPGFSDLLPWAVIPAAETALVVALWVLTVLGTRELVTRYRPPDVVPVSPSGR
ncbi:hypothetical protein HP550_03575 [Cellulomonas humilata]|uniref:Uncharacterized protein n=1 Tax=Cellulomonas humilata TaxID=144055 RepID=A0A7Y6DW78_9CELL|nr:hypothetical protein [Cellulomonas humilata]NUU16328.1 hypothetical protein [Cellulomonas humilata]